jgi:MFS family permease
MKGYASRFYSTDVVASLSIIIARVFYAVNWFNVAAIFPLIAIDFEQDISLLGSISAAFFIGVGIFQIPAGIFAAKYSPRTSAIFGIALSSTAALLYGFTSEASQLVWLRFIIGAGMAFFFSSGVVLIARYAGATSSGFSIGLMNSAHSIGGIVGIFAWIVIAQMVGWRPSLILAGAIGIATAILMIVAIPPEERQQPTKRSTDGQAVVNSAESKDILPQKARQGGEGGRWLNISEIWKILSSHQLIALGLVLTGVQASWALTVTFIVVYLQSLNVSLESTGIIASLGLISAIVSAPLIGRFYDRTVKDARKILLVCGVGIGASLAGMSVPMLPVIIAAVIAIGFFAGGAFTVAYTKARITRTIGSNDVSYDDRASQPDNNKKSNSNNMSHDAALNVAWINGLSLVGILWMPLVFSLAVKSGGYGSAWLLSAILAALFILVPLQKVRK